MQKLNDVYRRMQEKKRERKEIVKAFADALKHDANYQNILEKLKTLKEQKKSIENSVKAASMMDAQKLDTLKLDIDADAEMLSDIALTMYTKGEQVEIVDRDTRYVPVFSVRFKKDSENIEQAPQTASDIVVAEQPTEPLATQPVREPAVA